MSCKFCSKVACGKFDINSRSPVSGIRKMSGSTFLRGAYEAVHSLEKREMASENGRIDERIKCITSFQVPARRKYHVASGVLW